MRRYFIVTSILLTGLAACAPAQKVAAPTPVFTPPPPVVMEPRRNPGSLFDAAQSRMLFEDTRARRVGDIVMVQIVENSSGRHTADTTSEKESSLEMGVSNHFGKSNVRATPLFIPSMGLNGAVGPNPIVGARNNNEFEGTGETERESDLTATVGARVIKVLPSGLLQVEGARELRINEETQILVVRGLVRSEDIGPDNSITSNYLANARIEYYGQGVLADKQKPGWLSRVLDNMWPY